MFWAEIWKISEFFISENFQLLEVKFSIYLNRLVFVMRCLYNILHMCGINLCILCMLKGTFSFDTVHILENNENTDYFSHNIRKWPSNIHACSQPRFRSACTFRVWSESFTEHILDSQGCKVSSCSNKRLWSDFADFADVQADLSLHLMMHMWCQIVHFLLLSLIRTV